MAPNQSQERRHTARQPWREAIRVVPAEGSAGRGQMAMAENISERGIRLSTSVPYEPGLVLILEIPVAGTTVRIQSPAYLRWCSLAPTGGHRCGLEFII